MTARGPLFILVVCAGALPTEKVQIFSSLSPENEASKNQPLLKERVPIIYQAKITPILEKSPRTNRQIPWNFNLDPPHYEDLSDEIKPDPKDDIKNKEEP
jgi:hypothetical protein